MGFDAANSVEPLDYDFTQYVEGAKGVIPEPLQEDLDRLFDEFRQIGESASVGALAAAGTGEEARAALAQLPEGILGSLTTRLVTAVAALCKGTPSADEINALPVRVRQAFVDYILAETTRPTKRISGSSGTVVRSNGAVPAI